VVKRFRPDGADKICRRTIVNMLLQIEIEAKKVNIDGVVARADLLIDYVEENVGYVPS
jgi:hypothetical protein